MSFVARAAKPPADAAPGHPCLVADIGGTHARFAWLSAPGAAPGHVQVLAVADHAGPAEAARSYLQGLRAGIGTDWRPPRRAAFAVATAVTGDAIAFTNSPWAFSCEALRRALALDALAVLNDFEALALALPGLTAAQRRPLGGPPLADLTAAPVGTVLAVIGPGTGLGVGAVLRTRSGWQALPGEGGHATLAASDALEAAVIAVVRRDRGHVSAERLLAGPGLPLLYAALAEVQGRPPMEGATPAAIVDAARAGGGDALASETLALFARLLGGMAGNLALTLGARGGVFVGGGVVPRLGDAFDMAAFRACFEAKGRFQGYLAAVPTALVTDTLAALGGAALVLDAAAGADG
jgi:glucokinase